MGQWGDAFFSLFLVACLRPFGPDSGLLGGPRCFDNVPRAWPIILVRSSAKFGKVLVCVCNVVGVMLEPCWNHFGKMLGTHGEHMGNKL